MTANGNTSGTEECVSEESSDEILACADIDVVPGSTTVDVRSLVEGPAMVEFRRKEMKFFLIMDADECRSLAVDLEEIAEEIEDGGADD